MPELPDVQVFKELVDATSLHQRIEDVMLREEMVEESSPQKIRDRMRGAELEETRRHGKHLFLKSADDGWLRLHFGMTGDLVSYSTGEDPEHTQLRIDFDDGSHLAYTCQRKFGEISWVEDVDSFVEDQQLGPDALNDLDLEELRQIVANRRGSIKGTLMSQGAIAGLGNVYVDEILFQSGIHPESSTQKLEPDSVAALFESIQEVSEEAIQARAEVADMPDDWLLPHRGKGSSCPRDGATIEKVEVSGRPTYVCTEHQELID